MAFDPANPNDPNQLPPAYTTPPVSPYAPPGQPYAGSFAPDPAAAMAGPVKVLGICFIIIALFGLLAAVLMGTLLPMITGQIAAQAAAQNPGTPVPAIPGSFGTILAVFVGLFNGLLPLITGIGLLRRATWGRVLAIVVGILALLNFPFGTVLGVFTLYYMLRAGAKEGYDRLSRSTV